jgi:hypothetical protein
MASRGRYRRLLGGAVAAWGRATAATDAAQAATWSVEVAPAYVEVGGHDPRLLTVRAAGRREGVTLDTEAALGYRAAALYDRGAWAYGLDFFIHRTDQAAGPLSAAAGSAADPRTFELPHRSFTSHGPGEVLYYRTLEDTTVELWVLDLYARRRLAGSDRGAVALILGVRNADFDNDYRAIAGIGTTGGTRLDASSNYSRMAGPLVGVVGTLERGRHSLSAQLRQSVVFGDIELERSLRDFSGPPGPFAGPPEEVPAVPERARLAKSESITVPMTDLRLSWTVALGERWAVGASAGGTVWWDLAVPPGVDPSRPDALESTNLVTYDLAATLRFTF